MQKNWDVLKMMCIGEFLDNFKEEKKGVYTIKDDFLNELVDTFKTKSIYKGKKVSDAEKTSWANSLAAMATIFNYSYYESNTTKSIPRCCRVLLEFKSNITGKRVDMMICGQVKNENEELENIVIVVELKQWTKYYKGPETYLQCADTDEKIKENMILLNKKYKTHPSKIALDYMDLILDTNDFAKNPNNNVGFYSCSYLHNYHDRDNATTLRNKYKDLRKKSEFFYDINNNYGVYYFCKWIHDRMKDTTPKGSRLLAEGLINC